MRGFRPTKRVRNPSPGSRRDPASPHGRGEALRALSHSRLQALRRERRLPQPYAGGVEDGVGERAGGGPGRCFAGAGRRQFRMIDQNDVDRRHIWRVSATGGESQPLTSGETVEWNPVETSNGKTVLCLGSTATSPGMPYRLTNSVREPIAKNAIPAEFPGSQFVTPKQVVFKSEDGVEIHGQLFTPKHQKGRGPALIFTHGGPIRQMLLGFHYMEY